MNLLLNNNDHFISVVSFRGLEKFKRNIKSNNNNTQLQNQLCVRCTMVSVNVSIVRRNIAQKGRPTIHKYIEARDTQHQYLNIRERRKKAHINKNSATCWCRLSFGPNKQNK